MKKNKQDFEKEETEKEENTKTSLKNWEIKLLLTLIILLVVATIVDLNIPFAQVFKFIQF